MRRVARLGDGWLASGYNTTPARFRDGVAALPGGFPNAIATMWLHVTESRRTADRLIADVLAPMLRRPAQAVRELSLPIGPPELCAERISAYQQAGAERILVWPVGDELRQLELLAEIVAAS
jgi:alkanesulfonate monooxygenase SsuD/methylene tetrahydromethanopterin reductase-like flavin-dependent oxidoreductase (luciferase family)